MATATLIAFQFHKGTIKTARAFRVRAPNKQDFNSIKVRLKQKFPSRSRGIRKIFQFHKGTIKTKLRANRNHYAHPFQFHKGTIKTNR